MRVEDRSGAVPRRVQFYFGRIMLVAERFKLGRDIVRTALSA